MKLFFDECCSSRLLKKLFEVYEEDYKNLEILHLFDFLKAGTDDSVWISKLSQEQDWIVISADRGKDPKKERLPLLCKQLDVTHVLFSSAILNRGYAFQKQALLTVWPLLARASLLPPGTRVSLGLRSYKGGSEWPHLEIDGKAFDSICPKSDLTASMLTEKPRNKTTFNRPPR